MDPITQITNKIMAERARQTQSQLPSPPADAMPPPPYADSDSDSDADDDEPSSPIKLTINAAHCIQGSSNLVPTSPTPLADATKFSTLLMATINQINKANQADSETKSRRALNVNLTINCGITVRGDRNVIGNVGVRQKSGAAAMAGPSAVMGSNAVAGAKRKAEEGDDEVSPETKRLNSAPDAMVE